MEKLGLECFKMYIATETQLRVNPGFLLKDILDRFKANKEGKLIPKKQSFYIYSAHDTTIFAVLAALGLYDVISI